MPVVSIEVNQIAEMEERSNDKGEALSCRFRNLPRTNSGFYTYEAALINIQTEELEALYLGATATPNWRINFHATKGGPIYKLRTPNNRFQGKVLDWFALCQLCKTSEISRIEDARMAGLPLVNAGDGGESIGSNFSRWIFNCFTTGDPKKIGYFCKLSKRWYAVQDVPPRVYYDIEYINRSIPMDILRNACRAKHSWCDSKVFPQLFELGREDVIKEIISDNEKHLELFSTIEKGFKKREDCLNHIRANGFPLAV